MIIYIIVLSLFFIGNQISIAQGLNWNSGPESSRGNTFNKYQQEHECVQTDNQHDYVSVNNGNSYYIHDPEFQNYNTYHDQFSPQNTLESESSGPTDIQDDSVPRANNVHLHQPLPEGWEEFFDRESGRPYYYNVINRITTWTRPIPLEPPIEEVSSVHPGHHRHSTGGNISLEECHENQETVEVKKTNMDLSFDKFQVQNPDTINTPSQDKTNEEHIVEPAMIQEKSGPISFDEILEKEKKNNNENEDTEYSEFRKEQSQLPLRWNLDPKVRLHSTYTRQSNFQKKINPDIHEASNNNNNYKQNISLKEQGTHSQTSLPQQSPDSWECVVQTQNQLLQPRQLKSQGQRGQSLNPSLEMEPPILSEKQYQMHPVEGYTSQQTLFNQQKYYSSPYKHCNHLYQSSWRQQPSGLYSRQYWGQYGYSRIGGMLPYQYKNIRYQDSQHQLGQIHGQGQMVTQASQSTSTVKDAIGSAWQGVLGLGNRTKAVVGQARDSVVHGASQVGQSVSTTSFGIWGRAKESVESIGKSMFESGTREQETQNDDRHIISGYHISPSLGQHQSQFTFSTQNRSYFAPTYGKSGSKETTSYSLEGLPPKNSDGGCPPSSGSNGPSGQQRGAYIQSYWHTASKEGHHKIQPKPFCYGPVGNQYPNTSEWHPSLSRSVSSQNEQCQGGLTGGNPDYYPGLS